MDFRTILKNRLGLGRKYDGCIGTMLAALLFILVPLLAAAAPVSPHGAWWAEYFANTTLSGSPALSRYEAGIGFNWGSGSPGAGVPADNFSARWTQDAWFDDGTYRFVARSDDGLRVWVGGMPDDNFSIVWSREMSFAPGYYRIAVQSDDGVRVWLDGRLILDKWQPMNYELHYIDGTYLEGAHRFKVEYFEQNGQARIHFWVSPTPWKGEYYANPNLTGEPASVQLYETVDFDWGYGSPVPSLPAENFSARWTAQQHFARGWHTFDVTSDDGVRLYVDGRLVLDSWQPMHDSRSVRRYLTAGEHTVTLEYFEQTGVAMVRLSWQPDSGRF